MLSFHCPNCGCRQVEEVLTGVTVYSRVTDVDSQGDASYAGCDHQNGEVDHYQCEQCGAHVADSLEELTEKYAIRLDRWCEAVGLEDGDLDELVHELKGQEAAAINNGGLHAQVAFLIAAHGSNPQKVKAVLSDMFSIKEADGPLVQCCRCHRYALKSTSTEKDEGWVCDYESCQRASEE